MITAPRRLRAVQMPSVHGMRVMFLIDSLGPGGAERLMIDLLPRLRRLGIDPHVVAIQERQGNPVAAELTSVGIPVTTLGISRLRQSGALSDVTEVIRRIDPDVIHTQLEFANVLGSIAARRLGIPTISTIHTLDRPRRWSKEAAHFRLMAWTLRHRSDRVLAVSESARRHVLGRAGLTGKKTATIHNGIDLDPFLSSSARRNRARADFGISTDGPLLVTVAVLRDAKGIDDMIEALPTVLDHHPDTIYLIAGDGPHRRQLKDHAARLGLQDVVRFTGATDDVPGVLAAGDLFVLPSHTEALPTVVIEAMAAGLPIVATEVGGVPEMVTPGVEGILVPARTPDRLSEAVVRILSSPRQALSMGRAARRRAVEHFEIGRQAARLAEEYRVLVARKGAHQ